MKTELELIKKLQKEIVLLKSANSLLEWDSQTYIPRDGLQFRAEVKALIEKMIHEKMTSDILYSAIQKLKKEKLNSDDEAMVKRISHDVERLRKLPKEFVEEMSKASSQGFEHWLKAREKNDFKILQPYLENIINLRIKQAEKIGLPRSRYNSLLDEFEEGMTVEKLDPLFDYLKSNLISLLRKIEKTSKYKKQKNVLLDKKIPEDVQRELAQDVSERIGMKKDFSRIDFAEHPFSLRIGNNDVRLTTNIRRDPLFSFDTAVHEAGHGLYELQLPKNHIYDLLCDVPSLGVHESQAIFWEKMIGKSREFWNYYYKMFDKFFKIGDPAFLYGLVNLIEPGKIRIESDEVHYCLHIILRYEIEKALIEGEISIKELPELWNKKMKEYFGLEIKNDNEGILQDVHWSEGYFGYFPSYAIGCVYASQIFKIFNDKMPGVKKEIENGDFRKISEFLEENIHKHGKKFLAEELIQKLCGEGLNPKVFIEYLNKKFKDIYNFD